MLDSLVFENIEDLERYLQKNDIDTSEWGRGTTKPVRRLFEDLRNGESEIHTTDDGFFYCYVRAANVNVFYRDEDRTLFHLVEDRQAFTNGSEHKRTWLPTSLAEKMKRHEEPGVAAERAVREELGIAGKLDLQFEETREELTPSSKTYPGLPVRRMASRFRLNLTKEQYRASGYTEVQPDKTTFFVWQQTNSSSPEL